nr:MAG TPA: putative nucleotidyltransferase [Caudoviricetes sp.]
MDDAKKSTVKNEYSDLNLSGKIPTLEYVTISGSRAYGTNTEESDLDLRGFFMDPVNSLLGVKKSFEQHESKKPDVVIYSFRKFVRLLIKGSPNIIELLGTSSKDRIFVGKVAETLIQNKDMFLSRDLYQSFNGFAAHLQRFTLFYEKGNYDAQKCVMHMFRILFMGTEILQSGEINTWREKDKDFLLSVRNGKIPSTKISDYADEAFKKMREAYVLSRLPEKLDEDRINRYVINQLATYHNIKLREVEK